MGAFCCHGNQTKRQITKKFGFFSKDPNPVFAKTAGLSDKTGRFLFSPAKIFGLTDSCPANIQLPKKCLLLKIIDIFFHF